MVLYQAFGFIERDDMKGNYAENVYFRVQECGLALHDDLSANFEIGNRYIAS